MIDCAVGSSSPARARRMRRTSSFAVGASASVYAGRRLSELLVKAQDEAKRFKDEYTGVEHLYIALLKERGTPSAARSLIQKTSRAFCAKSLNRRSVSRSACTLGIRKCLISMAAAT